MPDSPGPGGGEGAGAGVSDVAGHLWAMLGGWGNGVHLWRLGEQVVWMPVEQEARFRRALAAFAASGRPVSLAAAPRRGRGSAAVAPPGVLWARVESGDSLRRLRGFRPSPTLVLRDGDTVRHTALWALARPIKGSWHEGAREANRRLAGYLRTPKKHAELGFEFSPPGMVVGRSRSRVVAASGELHDPAAVAGWLPASPDPWSWSSR